MTLYTDSLDWNANPATGMETTFYQTVVNAPGDLIGVHPLTGFEHAVFMWRVGGGEVAEMVVRATGQWTTEAGTDFCASLWTRSAGVPAAIPFTGMGQFLYLNVEAGTSFPFTVTYSLPFHNGPLLAPMLLADPAQIAVAAGVGPGATQLLYPNVFIPGRHQVIFRTDGALYGLTLDYLDSAGVWISQPLASNTVPLPFTWDFIAPPGAWRLAYTNNNVGAHNIDVYATLSPALI